MNSSSGFGSASSSWGRTPSVSDVELGPGDSRDIPDWWGQMSVKGSCSRKVKRRKAMALKAAMVEAH